VQHCLVGSEMCIRDSSNPARTQSPEPLGASATPTPRPKQQPYHEIKLRNQVLLQN
jgi:hypothetical protein